MGRSREGYLWTSSGISEGLETDAVASNTPSIKDSYDVVIIGAGFAGLIAARDLSQLSKLSTLLIEGRDRIGGRTWTANALGEQFEMGGTWVCFIKLKSSKCINLCRFIGISQIFTVSCNDMVYTET